MDPDIDKLGNLDLAIKHAPRTPTVQEPDAVLAYARASGRRFANIMERLSWPSTELVQLLRHRSHYINVHTEDVTVFTNRLQKVFP